MIPATCVLITKEKEYPDEILIELPPFEEMLIETECPSIYRRYELAKTARNKIVYIQDDDCLVNPVKLFTYYNGQLTNILPEHHQNFYRFSGITLLGFGAFFPKSMIDRFSIYLDKFGIDDLFLNEADRVFSFLNQPFNSVNIPVKNLPKAYAQDRMSLQSDHWKNLGRMINRLESLK